MGEEKRTHKSKVMAFDGQPKVLLCITLLGTFDEISIVHMPAGHWEQSRVGKWVDHCSYCGSCNPEKEKSSTLERSRKCISFLCHLRTFAGH